MKKLFFDRPVNLPKAPHSIFRGSPETNALRQYLKSGPEIESFEKKVLTGLDMEDLRTQFGERVAFYSGESLSIALFNWNDITQVLSTKHSSFLKGPSESIIGAVAGWGLATQEMSDHSKSRRDFSPAFHKSGLSIIPEIAEKIFEDSIHLLSSSSGFESVPTMRQLTYLLTLKGIIGATSISPLDSFESESYNLARSMTEFPFLSSPTSSAQLSSYQLSREHLLAHIDEIVLSIQSGTGVRADSFGALLGDLYTDGVTRGTGLHAQVSQFLVAGTETTASLMTTFLHYHSQSEELWADFVRAAKDEDSTEFYARIDEILRLYPPAPMITRVPLERISLDGLELPIGVQVYLSPYATHRNPRYFEDPLDFKWQRWTNSEVSRNEGFFPFGFGPRMCIGYGAAKSSASSYLRLFAKNLKPARLVSMPAVDEHFIVLNPARSEKLYFASTA
jgi:cytochrome P450